MDAKTGTHLVCKKPGGPEFKFTDVIDADPRFIVRCAHDGTAVRGTRRGDTLSIVRPDSRNEERAIVGVTFIPGGMEILAPRRVTVTRKNQPFIQAPNEDGNSVELRAGTSFIGDRNTGFPDGVGVILEAIHVGGDVQRWEDWAYYVVGPSWFREHAPQWILIGDIRATCNAPMSILDFPIPENQDIDVLLQSAEQEVLKYFARHPDKLSTLDSRQFEETVAAIYRSLGFTVEKMGNWNQADGGIDLIAIEKNSSGIEMRLAIQCKASRNAISARPIRELSAVLDRSRTHCGIVATTSRFTGPATDEAEGSLWRISLQDREQLVRKIISIVNPTIRSFLERRDK